MHKSPKAFRFITSGRDTALQNLSICVSRCLKKLLNVARTFEQYRIKELDECVCIIDNRDKVIQLINRANTKSGKQKQISSWDFSTLYTKIPHCQLKDNINLFVSKVYSFMDKEFIYCSAKNKSANFCKKRITKNDGFCFTKAELISAIGYIIDNSYISFKDQVFRQCIGIPMGTNCAPFLANIYLHVFEYNYLQNLVNNNQVDVAKKLCNLLRYQDDCISLNDERLFSEHFAHIYPIEMVLKNTNISRDKVTFLDLTVSIVRGKFLYYSYDKRDNFDFRVVNYPNLTGNIPSNQSYGTFVSQLVRFCEINLKVKSFIKDIQKLINTFIDQGFDRDSLLMKYKLFVSKFLHKWGKYNMDLGCTDVLNKLFPFRSAHGT